MSVAEKLTTIAENEQKVYDSGYNKSTGDFWDIIQDNGNRTDYQFAFARWNCETLKPKHKVKVVGGAVQQMCYLMPNIVKLEKAYFDLSKANSALSGFCSKTFAKCPNLVEIEDLGLPACPYDNTFRESGSLKKIAVIRSAKNFKWTYTFYKCTALENITFEGEIGKSIDFSMCKNLTIETLRSIVSHLADYAGTSEEFTYTVFLSCDSIALLQADGKSSPHGNTWEEYILDLGWNF